MRGKNVMNFARFLCGLMLSVCSCAGSAHESAKEGSNTLTVAGVERHYVLRAAPAVLGGVRRVPLVLVLHGGGGNAGFAERMTGFTEKALKEGFIVVYPDGSGRFKGSLLTWNAEHCCGYAMEQKIDDVGFISTLIDRLVAETPVDPRRVFVTGMSNGGMMTHRLGQELSQKITGIAPVVATVFGDEKLPAKPVAALMINGMRDASVPYLGGPPGGRFPSAWDGTPALPALEQAAFWAQANACDREPEVSEKGALVHRRYRCPSGQAVELYGVKDNGHAWPGGKAGSARGDTPSQAMNATDVMWRFFQAQ